MWLLSRGKENLLRQENPKNKIKSLLPQKPAFLNKSWWSAFACLQLHSMYIIRCSKTGLQMLIRTIFQTILKSQYRNSINIKFVFVSFCLIKKAIITD